MWSSSGSRWVLWLGAVLWATEVQAEDGDITVEPIPRGGQLVVVEERAVPLVALELMVPVGKVSRGFDDLDELAWMAQLGDSRAALSEQLDLVPAELDLWVSSDHVGLEARCLAPDLDRLVEVLTLALHSDYSGNATDLYQHQLDSFVERARHPSFRLSWAAHHLLFHPNDARREPYRKPNPMVPIASDLQRRRDAIMRRPERVLGLAGHVEPEQARRIARRLLAPSASDAGELPVPAVLPTVPASERARIERLSMDGIQQAWVSLVREGVWSDSPDAVALTIADQALRQRLQERLRDQLGITYAVTSSGIASRVPRVYELRVVTGPDHAELVIEELRAAVGELGTSGLSTEDRELAEQARYGWLGWHNLAPWDALHAVMTYLLDGSNLELEGGLRDRLEALSLEELNRSVQSFYQEDAFSAVLLLPEEP